MMNNKQAFVYNVFIPDSNKPGETRNRRTPNYGAIFWRTTDAKLFVGHSIIMHFKKYESQL